MSTARLQNFRCMIHSGLLYAQELAPGQIAHCPWCTQDELEAERKAHVETTRQRDALLAAVDIKRMHVRAGTSKP